MTLEQVYCLAGILTGFGVILVLEQGVAAPSRGERLFSMYGGLTRTFWGALLAKP